MAVRSGPEYQYFPMVRETVMTAVSWPKGEWPVFTPISGEPSVWAAPGENLDVDGLGYVYSSFFQIQYAPNKVMLTRESSRS